MSAPARIRFTCTHCNRKLSVPPAGAGRTLPCPNPECGEPITVPPPDASGTAPPAVPANAPTIVVLTPPSKRSALGMIAAALSMVPMGLGLAFFLMKPYVHPHKARAVVKALAHGDHKAAVKAALSAKAAAPPSNSPESQRKLVAAKQQKSKAAQKEQAARKERSKTLAEYAVLARILSFEYYHNDRRVIPRWHRPDSEVTRERNLSLPKYDDHLPRIRPLARSANADIRNVAISILKAYEIAEIYRRDGSGSPNVIGEIQNLVVSSESYDQFRERRALMLGQPSKSGSAVDAANWRRAGEAAFRIYGQLNANRPYSDAVDELTKDQKRISYKLAKEFAGPQPDAPVGIQLSVEAFAPGEDVFRSAEPSANANYCITVANEGKKLTHCSIAALIRYMTIRRSVRASRPGFGPPFGLDEFTEAVLRPEASQEHWDGVVLYYIGDLNTHERVHFLDVRGEDVREKVERIGVVMFSDQMTVVGDPNPWFEVVSEHHP